MQRQIDAVHQQPQVPHLAETVRVQAGHASQRSPCVLPQSALGQHPATSAFSHPSSCVTKTYRASQESDAVPKNDTTSRHAASQANPLAPSAPQSAHCETQSPPTSRPQPSFHSPHHLESTAASGERPSYHSPRPTPPFFGHLLTKTANHSQMSLQMVRKMKSAEPRAYLHHSAPSATQVDTSAIHQTQNVVSPVPPLPTSVDDERDDMPHLTAEHEHALRSHEATTLPENQHLPPPLSSPCAASFALTNRSADTPGQPRQPQSFPRSRAPITET